VQYPGLRTIQSTSLPGRAIHPQPSLNFSRKHSATEHILHTWKSTTIYNQVLIHIVKLPWATQRDLKLLQKNLAWRF